MNSNGRQVAATAEPIPENTNETYALDQSEQEYNRMISQHMTYHRTMMDDLMKLSSESGSGSNPPSQEFLNVVSGLGTTVGNIDASNKHLLHTATKYVDRGKDRTNTVSKLNAYMKTTSAKLKDDINAYDAITNKEGFANANPTMNAALEMSEIMNESQKYALVIFGSVSVYLLYKIVKHL
jgi:hypothetical protein